MVITVLEVLQMQALQYGIYTCFGLFTAEHIVERGKHHIFVYGGHKHLIIGVLKHKAKFSADLRQGVSAYFNSVYKDFSLPFQQTEQKLHN